MWQENGLERSKMDVKELMMELTKFPLNLTVADEMGADIKELKVVFSDNPKNKWVCIMTEKGKIK